MPTPDIKNIASLVEGVASQLEAALRSTSLRKDDNASPAGASPPPDASAGPPPGGPPDAPPPGAPGDQPDPMADADPTPEQLQAEFSAMPVEKLQIWAQAVNAALAQVMGGQPGADGPGAPGGAPPPGMDAGGPPPDAAGGPPPGGPPDDGMGKGEDDGNGAPPTEGMSKAQFDAIMGRLAKAEEAVTTVKSLNAKVTELTTKLSKSESELAAAKTAADKQAADVATVAAGVSKILSTKGTLRKTVAGVSAPAATQALKKSQGGPGTSGLTPDSKRSEIFPHVQRITKEPRSDLAKSERDELVKWTVDRSTPNDRVIQILDAHPPL